MTDSEEAKPKKRKISRTRSPHHRVVYANQIMLTKTAVDGRLRFGCIESISDDEVVVEDQVDVILGPIELAGLHVLLERNLNLEKIDKSKLVTEPIGDDKADG